MTISHSMDRLTERASRIPRVHELTALLAASQWFEHVLAIAAGVDAPQWWICAGVIRDLVWSERFGSGFDPTLTRDVDLAFFDPLHLEPERDRDIELSLRSRDPSIPWDAKNQAAVHRWYPQRFGVAVEPFTSADEAVATFPEFAVCVAVRRAAGRTWDVAAPYGLHDLLDGIWRRNPSRVTEAEYRSRLERKRPRSRWASVRVDP